MRNTDYYAIKYSGRTKEMDLIFTNYTKANTHIHGYTTIYKKFDTKEECITYFNSFTEEDLQTELRRIEHLRVTKHGVKIDRILIYKNDYEEFIKLAEQTNRTVIEVIQSCLKAGATKLRNKH